MSPQSIEISPHCSLTSSSAALFFLSTCGVSLAFAGLLALQGFWPVFPFAGLEMAALGWALKVNMSRRARREIITVSEDDVRIERHIGANSSQVIFPRHWAQVKLRRPASRLHPSRLTIESHGRQCEVGQFLTESERRGLALRLGSLIGRINESPALV